MRSLVKKNTSTEIRAKWLTELFLLQEYIDEWDAIINGPDAFGNKPLRLSARDWELLTDTMVNPPEPNEALIALFREYGSSNKH